MSEMSEPTTSSRSISSVEVSPASPSPEPVADKPRKTIAGSGPSSPVLFASFDPDTCSLKTCPASSRLTKAEQRKRSSGTWPRWGLMRSGQAFQLPRLALPILDGESSLWPTPTARLGTQRGPQAKRYFDPRRSNDLDDAVAASYPQSSGPCRQQSAEPEMVTSGQLNPAWVEVLMGFPLEWSETE